MSIASALFSDSQCRVFTWLFGQPERSYHLSELRRLTGLGSASLQRELNCLAEDAAHRKRNLAEYEGFLEVEESTLVELCDLTDALVADVAKMLG